MKILNPILLISSLIVSTSAIQAEENQYQFDITSQNLGAALQKFAAQSKNSIFYTASSVDGRNAPSLKGKYALGKALSELLKGSGLVFTIEANNISIKPEVIQQPNPQQANNQLPTIKVVGKKRYQYKADDPYNPNYVIPNATAGTKTDTPVMETPLNIQVISKQVLKDQQVITLDQALQNVSGVTMLAHNNNFGINYLTPVLRGFASQTFFRDGFRLQSGSASRQFANVESIEVLKGPAAILYGQVEPGGMINVVTKKPQATPFHSLTQQFGSYDMYRTTLDTTGPVGNHPDLLYRLNASYQNSNSFRDFVYTDDMFIAPSLTWIVSPKTKIGLQLEYDHNSNGWDSGYIPLYNGNPMLNFSPSVNFGELSPITQETYFGNFNWSHQFNDDWSVKHQFSVNQIATNANLYFPDPLQGQDIGNYLIHSRRIVSYGQNNTYASNLDLTGHFNTFGLKHTLLIGGDYYRLAVDTTSGYSSNETRPGVNALDPVHVSFIPPPISPYSIGVTNQNTDQYGAYLQDQIKLPFNFHVMGGIRYQYLHQSLNTQDYSGSSAVAFVNDALTPRVGLLWQPKNWLSLYTNYVESFGANTTGLIYASPTTATPIPATSAKQYEIGAKTEFFEGRLRATLAYYDLYKTNIATADPDRTHLCAGATCYLVIGEARSQGPELDIQGEILPGWKAIATFANTSVVITKSTIDSPVLGTGRQFPGIPANTASFWSTYNFEAQPMLRGFTVGAGINYSDYQLSCCTTVETHHVAAYETVRLMASYSRNLGDAKVTVQLNVDNLLDQRYFTGYTIDHFTATDYGGPIGEAFGVYGTPRMFIGSISMQY